MVNRIYFIINVTFELYRYYWSHWTVPLQFFTSLNCPTLYVSDDVRPMCKSAPMVFLFLSFYLSYFFSPLLYGRHAWPHLFSHPKWWVCKTSLPFASIDLLRLPLTLASLRYSSTRPCVPKGGWTHRTRRAHQALHDDDKHTPHGELKRSDPATTKRDAREHCSEELGDWGGLSDIDVTKEEAKGDEVGHTIEHGLGHHRGCWVEHSLAPCLLVPFSTTTEILMEAGKNG